MKVAIVTRFPLDPGKPRGGVESVGVNLVESLAQFDDLDINVVTTSPESRSMSISRWGKVTVHRLPWVPSRTLVHAIGPGRRQMQKYLLNLKPDLIHAHDTFGLMVKGMSIPRVFTIHGFIYADTLVSGTRFAWLRSKLWKWIETTGWADQPHIISISPYVRERLKGIVKGVVHDIDNPITESFFHINREEQNGTIFSAAWISPRKNTLTLVEAFAKLIANGIDAKLRLAGEFRNKTYGQKVLDKIRSYGLKDRIFILGRIDPKQIHQELSAASVFILVSLEENSPMSIEEAMAAGVPVVASNRCGMPYMVRDGESGFLVDPSNPDEIAERISELLQDDSLRIRMGEKGRQIAKDRFHPSVVARRTREVYLRAVHDHERGKRQKSR